MNLLGGRRKSAPPDPSSVTATRILLASEGRVIPPGAVEAAARLAKQSSAPVRVFSVARIWGSGLGLPMPGLLPSKREWDQQRELVLDAVRTLRKQGLEADGHVLATRKATKRIVSEAERLGCDVIVGASPDQLADLLLQLSREHGLPAATAYTPSLAFAHVPFTAAA